MSQESLAEESYSCHCCYEDVGLLVIDPGLKIMGCTKENAAAQAFAELGVILQSPSRDYREVWQVCRQV